LHRCRGGELQSRRNFQAVLEYLWQFGIMHGVLLTAAIASACGTGSLGMLSCWADGVGSIWSNQLRRLLNGNQKISTDQYFVKSAANSRVCSRRLLLTTQSMY